MPYYKNDHVLAISGYEVYFTRFADSILEGHFKDAKKELEDALNNFYIPEKNIIEGGGGLSSITQSLAELLDNERWKKKTIKTELHIDGKIFSPQAYDLNHYKSFPKGNIGLKIQWNSKDPVFDSNLEDLRKLYQVNALSIGIVITRGESLQSELFFVYQRFLTTLVPLDIETLQKHFRFSANARAEVIKIIDKEGNGREAIPSIAHSITSSKFGTATTHMSKLKERLDKSLGDPCPLILIGIGKERLQP
jgi:hypothetical protein